MARGFTDVSIDDIARAAGVTKGALYFYYKKKDDLLMDVIKKYVLSYLDGITDAIGNATGSTRERVERLFFAVPESEERFVEATGGMPFDFRSFFLLLMEGLKKFPLIDKRYALFHQGIKDKVKEVLEEGKRRGDVVETLDSEDAAFLLYGCAEGLMMHWVVNPEIDFKSLLRNSCNLIWSGIITQDSRDVELAKP